MISLPKEAVQELISYEAMADFFGLSQAQREHPNAGIWMIDCIKQYQQTSQLAKSMRLLTDVNLKIETYPTTAVNFPKDNPLLPVEKTENKSSDQ